MPNMPRPKKALRISDKVLRREGLTRDEKQANNKYYKGGNDQRTIDIKDQIVR